MSFRDAAHGLAHEPDATDEGEALDAERGVRVREQVRDQEAQGGLGGFAVLFAMDVPALLRAVLLGGEGEVFDSGVEKVESNSDSEF